MSDQITTAFVDQFKSTVDLLVQQQGSRLRDSVMVETGTGNQWFTEQIGSTSVVAVASRHGDSPLVNSPHARRMLTLTDYEWGDLIDDEDRIRILIDPQGPYATNASYAFGRQMDITIRTAATAAASTGVDGTTSTALPAGQQVAVDYVETGGATDSNLTVAKLREAKKILDANEVPPDDRFCAFSADNLRALLTDTEVTSSDFNAVKALVQGELDTFLGFKFIQTEQLAITGTNVRSVLCYHRNGIKLGVGADIMTEIERRPDKRFSTYVYLRMSIGATRLQEEMVVEVLADEDL